MKRRTTLLIEIEGEVWRFTAKQWERFVRDGATGGWPSPLGHGARSVGSIDHHPLDWGASEFRGALAELRGCMACGTGSACATRGSHDCECPCHRPTRRKPDARD